MVTCFTDWTWSCRSTTCESCQPALTLTPMRACDRQAGLEDRAAQHVAHEVHASPSVRLLARVVEGLDVVAAGEAVELLLVDADDALLLERVAALLLPAQKKALWPSALASIRNSSPTPPPKLSTFRRACCS
jgi:hypothetical protein